MRLWVHTYMGPPDFLARYQGPAYVSKETKYYLKSAGLVLQEAPIEILR